MIAAVTMVYNEPEFLPLWIDYYGKQVGLENCYVVDNGTDDGSVDKFKSEVNVIRVPRLFKDNLQRTRFLSDFCSSLLHYFSHVIHIDVDEFLIANPLKYKNLKEYIDSWDSTTSSVTSIGLNVTHIKSKEEKIDVNRKILNQRHFVRFISPMCKPAIIHKPIQWTPGFHGSNHPVNFDDLFMFHLRYFDLEYGLKRLERTRSMSWKTDKEGLHQRVEDETWLNWFDSFEKFRLKGQLLTKKGLNDELRLYLDELKSQVTINEHGRYKVPMKTPNTLFEIPTCFKDYF